MKFTKDEVDFESPAKGKDHCGQCMHYDAPRVNCDIVSGHILPRDWCNQFEKESVMAQQFRKEK